MSTAFQGLSPEKVWYYFGEICKVPRPSKKEKLISDYIISVARRLNLENEIDETGNILIRKPATEGYSHFPIVILQSHIDMVCEKNSETDHDFDTDRSMSNTSPHMSHQTCSTHIRVDFGIAKTSSQRSIERSRLQRMSSSSTGCWLRRRCCHGRQPSTYSCRRYSSTRTCLSQHTPLRSIIFSSSASPRRRTQAISSRAKVRLSSEMSSGYTSIVQTKLSSRPSSITRTRENAKL